MHVALSELTAATLLLAFFSAVRGLRLTSSPAGRNVPERFIIDLDKPPSERWREVALAYRDILPSLLFEVDREARQRQEISKVNSSDWLRHHNIPAEYVAELSGFVGFVDHPEATLERLVLWQLAYEIGLAYWSSGVLAADLNGTVIHGRNVDNPLRFIARGRHMDAEDLVIETLFVRAGNPLFTSVGLLGQLGVTTGMKMGAGNGPGSPSSWSFQHNSRRTSLPKSNFAAARYGGLPHAFLARSLLERDLDFKQAVRQAQAAKLMAPAHLLLAGGGPWQGAVLVMDRIPERTKRACLRQAQVLSPSIGRWFLVQTSRDLWTEGGDGKRPDGIQLMSSLGQSNVNTESITLTMRTAPLFNELTTLTWLGVPATGQTMVYKARQSLSITAKSGIRPEAALMRLGRLTDART